LIDWIQCKTSFVEYAKNPPQDSTSEHLHVKAANPFSGGHLTIRPLYQNAKIITDVLLTKRIEQHAKHAVLESVLWLECQNQDPVMVDAQTGSKFIA
jgi:hypothetical protein